MTGRDVPWCGQVCVVMNNILTLASSAFTTVRSDHHSFQTIPEQSRPDHELRNATLSGVCCFVFCFELDIKEMQIQL